MQHRVILVNMATSSSYRAEFKKSHSMPPLGLLYIGTVLEKAGFSVDIIDLSVETFTREQLLSRLRVLEPNLIGVSTYMEAWTAQKVLCAFIKKYLPTVPIVAGGAFATFCYQDMFNESGIDYVIRGEGENSMLLLAQAISQNRNASDIHSIPGIVYRDISGATFLGPDNERIKDLNSLPIPNRRLVPREQYAMPFTISTTRGCPGDCIFCSSRGFWGKAVHMRSAENIYSEIRTYYEEYRDTFFYVADDTLTSSRKRVFELCSMLKGSGINYAWGCESRADVIDQELLGQMVAAGCRKIQFGFESADDKVLAKLGKKITVKQIENAVTLAHSFGLHVSVSFIIGHAFDTSETIEKTLEFAKYLNHKYGAYLMGSINTPFPGTRQYNEAKELGITILSRNWDEYRLNNVNISTQNLSRETLQKYYDKVLTLLMIN